MLFQINPEAQSGLKHFHNRIWLFLSKGLVGFAISLKEWRQAWRVTSTDQQKGLSQGLGFSHTDFEKTHTVPCGEVKLANSRTPGSKRGYQSPSRLLASFSPPSKSSRLPRTLDSLTAADCSQGKQAVSENVSACLLTPGSVWGSDW